MRLSERQIDILQRVERMSPWRIPLRDSRRRRTALRMVEMGLIVWRDGYELTAAGVAEMDRRRGGPRTVTRQTGAPRAHRAPSQPPVSR